MAQVLQLRRGTTAQNDAFTGAVAEVSVDTDRDSLRVHDGTTMGGKEIAPLNVAIPLLADATTVNAADELIVRQGGVVKRATGAELAKGLNAVNGIVSVKDLGAAGDGTTDDTAAFTAALFASAAIVLIPAGNYYIPNPSAIAASTPKLWMAANAYFRTTVGGTLLPFSGIFYGEIMPRDFGPIAIANDNIPQSAGQNAGLKVITGKFPTATPASNDRVAATFICDNIDKTTAGGGIWGLNCLAIQSPVNSDSSSATDCMVHGMEIEVCKILGGANPDPWSGGAPFRSNGIEIVGTNASVYQNTAAIMTWANDATGSKWWQVGAAFSRITKWGILFKKDPNGSSDGGAAFGDGTAVGAAIRDESNSTSVISASGTHTNFLNIADCSGVGSFARLPNSFDYNATFRNFADHTCRIAVDSGNTAGQQVAFALGDRGNFKWELTKLSNNKLNLFNYDNSASAVLFETTGVSTIDGVFSTRLIPNTDNTYDLGSATKEWKDIYTQNAVTVSDAREKVDVADSDLGIDFVRALRPVKYKMAVAEKVVTETDENGLAVETESRAGSRYHYGLLAQEVRDVIPEGGDFAGWVLADKNNPQSRQSLRYHQFIAPIIKAIQQLDERVEELESA